MNGGRKTALTLVLAILAFELLRQGQVQAAWRAMWGTRVPLGQGMSGASTSSSSGGSTGSTTPGQLPSNIGVQQL